MFAFSIILLWIAMTVSASFVDKRVDDRLYYHVIAPGYAARPAFFCPVWAATCSNLAVVAGTNQTVEPNCNFNPNLDGGVIMAACGYYLPNGTYINATPAVGALYTMAGLLNHV